MRNNKLEEAVTMARKMENPYGVLPKDELNKLGQAIMNTSNFSKVQKSMSMFSLCGFSQNSTHLIESMDLLTQEIGDRLQSLNFKDEWTSFRKFEALDKAQKSNEAGYIHELLYLADRKINFWATESEHPYHD